MKRFKALTNGIAADGNKHNITVLAVDVDKSALSNVHHVELENVYDILYGDDDNAAAMNITEMAMKESSTSEELTIFGDWCNIVCEGL